MGCIAKVSRIGIKLLSRNNKNLSCTKVVQVVFQLYFSCTIPIYFFSQYFHHNFAPQSRDKRSLVAVQSFFCASSLLGLRLEASSLIGFRLEASSPRDSPSKLGSPLGSSLLDILEQSSTIATGLLCILHKPFNVVIKEHDINIIYI